VTVINSSSRLRPDELIQVMTLHKTPLRACLLALLLPASGLTLSTQAADPKPKANPGATLYQSCAQCHGEKGEGIEATLAPRLAGREGWFIKRQLEEFRRRQRGKDESVEKGYLPPPERTQVMHPVTDSLKGSEVQALIAYIATLRPEPVGPVRVGDPKRGRELYAACVSCHGAKAQGSRWHGAPRLTEQADWYLFNQLRDFRMGWRGMASDNPHVKLMRRELDRDDKSMRDLTAYIVSLNAPPRK